MLFSDDLWESASIRDSEWYRQHESEIHNQCKMLRELNEQATDAQLAQIKSKTL